MPTTYLPSDCSIGIIKEVTYGTVLPPTSHIEFIGQPTLQKNVGFMQGEGLRVGRVGDRFDHRVMGKVAPSGDITVQANSVDSALFLAAAFGSTTLGGASAPYGRLSVCASGGVPPSYTIQTGVPLDDGSAIEQHTFSGMVCDKLAINVKNDAILEFTSSWMGKDMDTTTAYVTPAYTANTNLFHFYRGSLAVGGTVTMPTALAAATGGTPAANIRDCTINLANNLDPDGWNFGGVGKRTRIQAYGRRKVTGTMTAEFNATTLRDASLAGTGLSLLLSFTTPTANELLQIVLPVIALDSNVPNGNGGALITQSFAWTAFEDGTDAYAYALLQNTVAGP